jgi:hypothetical protein
MLHDLKSFVRSNQVAPQSIARPLIRYIATAVMTTEDIDPHVFEYLAQASRRADKDSRHDLKIAFGLKRARAGNPGKGARLRKRQLTEDGRIELGERIAELMLDSNMKLKEPGDPRRWFQRVTQKAAKEFNVGERTAAKCLRELKESILASELSNNKLQHD